MVLQTVLPVLGLISSFLGGDKDKQQPYQLQAGNRQKMSVGDAVGQPQPSQQPPMPGQQVAATGWDRLQAGVGKANTIANIIGLIKGLGSDEKHQPYQMQMRRRQ